MQLTQKRLKELLTYDPDTGVFVWAVSRGSVKKGDAAGKVCDGYRRIQINGMLHTAHRLAFLFMTGAFPDEVIDHINVDPLDNRWANLRIDSCRQNNQNRKYPQRNNTSGFLGVSMCRRSCLWVAQIKYDRKVHKLGLFGTPEEAHAAYLVAKRKHHSFCTI